MTKKNPDDSVRIEQSGAIENALGTEDATQAENAQKPDSMKDSEENEKSIEKVIENEEHKPDDESGQIANKEEQAFEDAHSLDDIALPEVDYSGYTKHELVETLGLLIENRPALEIRDDVERLKILFYKKLKNESEERKTKFLEDGGKIEEYRQWVDPDEAPVSYT